MQFFWTSAWVGAYVSVDVSSLCESVVRIHIHTLT